MTADTVEQQKQLYSKQLAAHTLRQWNSVRQNTSQDSQNKRPGKPSNDKPNDKSASENNSNGGQARPTTPGRGQSYTNSKKDVQVIDYALQSRKHGQRPDRAPCTP
ncbi:hypothetical protein BDQ12DRAFT_721026 [Crucibulum laeve]|uniref:Uncharacterized protein n=1 Tax=Crucibulum laeve TaxID=68775 RepID=A0A5C3M9G2_9AGAR|nr:hypothetical protein BDQ12DRAFT_721026 [Crucibulum laeve]